MPGSCQMQKYVSFGNMITDAKIPFHLKEMQLGTGQAWRSKTYREWIYQYDKTVHIDYNQFHNLSVNIVISLTSFTGSHVSCSILIIFWMDTHFVALISYKSLSACQGTYFVNLKYTHAKQRGYW